MVLILVSEIIISFSILSPIVCIGAPSEDVLDVKQTGFMIWVEILLLGLIFPAITFYFATLRLGLRLFQKVLKAYLLFIYLFLMKSDFAN